MFKLCHTSISGQDENRIVNRRIEFLVGLKLSGSACRDVYPMFCTTYVGD